MDNPGDGVAPALPEKAADTAKEADPKNLRDIDDSAAIKESPELPKELKEFKTFCEKEGPNIAGYIENTRGKLVFAHQAAPNGKVDHGKDIGNLFRRAYTMQGEDGERALVKAVNDALNRNPISGYVLKWSADHDDVRKPADKCKATLRILDYRPVESIAYESTFSVKGDLARYSEMEEALRKSKEK